MSGTTELETDMAQHIAALLNENSLTGRALVYLTASANGPLIHLTTQQQDEDRQDAWVLTVEWDGQRDG